MKLLLRICAFVLILPLSAYADNITVTQGSGKTVGFDDISSVNIQRVKPIFGVDGTNAGDVATGNPFPVQFRTSGGTETGTAGNPIQCSLANTAANSTAVKVDGSAVTQPISVASIPSHAVTNAGTFVTQENGALLTSSQLIDDGISTTGSAVPAKGFQCTGTDGTNARAVKTDSSGELQIDVLTMPTVTVTDGSGALNVIVDSGTVTAVTAITNALPAGTNAIGKLAANSGVDIGDVDVTSISAGNNNIGDVDIASIAAGSNAIGKLAANSGVDIGDVDITSEIPGTGATNLGKPEDGAATGGDTGVAVYGIRNDALASNVGSDGDYGPPVIDKANRTITLPFAPPEAKVRGCASATGTSDTSTVVASGNAGLKTYIVACQIANTGSTTALITLKDGSGGSTLDTTIAPAGGGSNMWFPVELVTTANTALYFAAGSSSTTVYVCCQGYKAP